MLLKDPPVTRDDPPTRADSPLWPIQQQLERFYNSRYAADLLAGDAVSASYGGPQFGPHVPGAPGIRTEGRHVAPIHRALEAHAETFPLHVRTYALPALQHIHHEWAAAIVVCYLQGVPVPEYARVVRVRGVHPSTVQHWLERGLKAVAELLFDKHGHLRVPEELRDV